MIGWGFAKSVDRPVVQIPRHALPGRLIAKKLVETTGMQASIPDPPPITEERMENVHE